MNLLLASMLILCLALPIFAARSGTEWVAELRGQLPALDLTAPAPPGGAAGAYFDYYGLELPGAEHHFGAVDAGGYRIAVHLYRPANARGTVFLVHGYLDHSGLLVPLLRLVLEEGYAVLAFDLPGHGLSSGVPGDIDDFATYATVVEAVLAACGSQLPHPLHTVSHSTGCAILYEWFQRGGAGTFDSVVFLAPLVRSSYWHLSRAGSALAEPFVTSIPRSYRENSSDPGYLRRVRSDPLRIEEIPIGWVEAHQAWYDRVQTAKVLKRPVLIVQGTADDVVDWEYNVPFLQARLTPAKVRWVPGARHQLIHESAEFREPVFRAIREQLRRPDRGAQRRR